MLAHANRCAVCGWRGEDEVCPRCGTVLLRGRAFCRQCGKIFEGILARCDACGGVVETPPAPHADDAIERLAQLPGVSRHVAQDLHARGFREPADVLKLALPERAVRLGLHRTLARKAAMGELRPVPRTHKAIACTRCGAERVASTGACPACGARAGREPQPEEIRATLEKVTGIVHDLTADPDFRGMPASMREEILEAFEGAGLSTSVDSEFSEQIREWKARGFDTRELERVLRDEGPDAFRAKSVPVIRAQLLKRRNGERFLCPLCDVRLEPTSVECENCGAKFR